LDYQFAREFSLTEGAARGTRGHLGAGGGDQRVFVTGIVISVVPVRASGALNWEFCAA
jgi:hypothetical protein